MRFFGEINFFSPPSKEVRGEFCCGHGMGNPEETVAAAGVDMATIAPEPVTTITAEPAVTTEPATEDLTGALVGWKRKLSGKAVRGTPGKKKDVSFVAPDGEEIKTKRQLDKYLKAHPGTLTASDFEWGVAAVETPPENRRRSARLNSKGRTSTDGADEEPEPKQPVMKRSRKSRENGKDENDGKGGPISSDKEKENGEGNGETKAMDVDASEVEIPAAEETKEMTADTIAEKSEDEKPVSTEPLDAPPEPSVEVAAASIVVDAPEGNGAVEKAIEVVEIPPPQGIHALVGEVPKPQGVEAAQEPETVL